MLNLSESKKFITVHSRLLIWLLIVSYILLFSFLCLKKLDLFFYTNHDLAIFNQVFWNTLHGRWFEMTVNANNYLADHFSPIIILLIPVYALFPGPQILLIIQSAIVALCVWPLVKITDLVLPNKIWGVVIALVWLFNPLIHSGNFYEFHLLHLAAFFVLWFFYFYQKDNFWFFVIFLLLSLLVREDISLILLGFIPLVWLDKKTWRWKLTIIMLPLAYFIFSIKLISFFHPAIVINFLFTISGLEERMCGQLSGLGFNTLGKSFNIFFAGIIFIIFLLFYLQYFFYHCFAPSIYGWYFFHLCRLF